jgi:hypothetical protein
LLGRWANLTTASMEGSGSLTVSTGTFPSAGFYPGLGRHNDTIVIAWTDNYNTSAYGRFYDLTTDSFSGDQFSIRPGVGSAGITHWLQEIRIATSGNRFMTSWYESRADILGPLLWAYQDARVMPFPPDVNLSTQYGLNNFFVAPLMEREYTIKAEIRD